MGKLGVVVVALSVACAQSHVGEPPPDGSGNVGPDAGTPPVDAGNGPGNPHDGGSPPDAGNPPDGGTPDAGPKFGGPGPWPTTNVTYGAAEGIQESPVVGITTDETQNIWVATKSALYVMRPGQTRFTRFDGNSGSPDASNSQGVGNRLHLASNQVMYCDNNFGNPDNLSPGPDHACPIYGAADPAGISSIVGGGENEVFVGYVGTHNWDTPEDGTWADGLRHTGKLDRVRLKADGSLEVIRFDMVSSNTPMFWHNRTVYRMVYDHFLHRHELFVGTDHGVDKFSPDLWKPTTGWFLNADNYLRWMSDHLHAVSCFHQLCTGDENRDSQRMGDWRGLAIGKDGNLWIGGRWSAGKILYTAPNTDWYQSPRPPDHKTINAFIYSFGFTFCGTAGHEFVWVDGTGWVDQPCSPGSGTPPVFVPPYPGEIVSISAVAETPDGRSWWSSASVDSNPSYGLASFDGHQFTYYDPVRIGAGGPVWDMVALPDGRLALGTQGNGITLWNPATGATKHIGAGNGLADDNVQRMELDMMVDPPALHVATSNGAATIRQFP